MSSCIKATKEVAKLKGPVYLRLHRAKFEPLTKKSSAFEIGKAQVLQRGKRITIIGSGPILTEVMKASKELRFKPEIINCHTIKPLDEKTILRSVKKTKKVLVVQDHQVYGGLGSAVTELLSEKYPVMCKIIGMQDKFGESGKPRQLWEKYGLDSTNILKEIRSLVR